MQIKYMKNHSDLYRIAKVDGNPAGYVGVIEDDIRVCTHPDYQGKGVGKFMINEIMKEEPTAFAKVKMDNEVSIKLFEACGFTKKFYILTKD
jgi:ribosomal protein S18 acetylase RimI-like enzyme